MDVIGGSEGEFGSEEGVFGGWVHVLIRNIGYA